MTWNAASCQVHRVADPGFSLELEQPEAIVADLRANAGWLWPSYLTEAGKLRIGSSAIVITRGGSTDGAVLVDPFLAFDASASTPERCAAIEAQTGVSPGQVALVINSHIDGVGANITTAGEPAFPNATYVVPGPEIDAIRRGQFDDAEGRLSALADMATPAESAVTPSGISLVDAPGHNSAHVAVAIGDGPEPSVLIIGHLFLHPAQISAPEVVTEPGDQTQLIATRREVLERCAKAGTTLIGPLFEAPGGGTVSFNQETGRHELGGS